MQRHLERDRAAAGFVDARGRRVQRRPAYRAGIGHGREFAVLVALARRAEAPRHQRQHARQRRRAAGGRAVRPGHDERHPGHNGCEAEPAWVEDEPHAWSDLG
ncbi:MAG: hypothetical protein JSR59_05020 [Proteobacteria bacterium]|nr:hypothetical protein [Pseudomonadota bacterium]